MLQLQQADVQVSDDMGQAYENYAFEILSARWAPTSYIIRKVTTLFIGVIAPCKYL